MIVFSFLYFRSNIIIENIYSYKKKNADLGPTNNLEPQNSVSLLLSNVIFMIAWLTNESNEQFISFLIC